MSQDEPRHLSDGQIVGFEQLAETDEAMRHFRSCAECRARVAEWREARAALSVRKEPSELKLERDCPPMEELAAYAIAAQDSDHRDTVADHVMRCERCAAILHDSLDRLDVAPPPRPLTFRRSPPPSVENDVRRALGFSSFWRYAAVAAVSTGVSATMILWWIQWRAPDASMLLAKSYTEARPFLYRLPDAGYAHPRSKTKGSSKPSDFEQPEALDRAVVIIRRGLAAQPRSANWLELKGRSELLKNDYKSAINTLERANQGDANAETDLAIAYALRADSDGQTQDYGLALDLLMRALKQRPGDARIQFNLALVYENLLHYPEAIETWRKFLSGNPPEEWRSEAAARLDDLEKKMNAKQHADNSVMRDPTRFLLSYGSGLPFDPLPWYDVFWTDWLPQASSDPKAANAARLIASGFSHFGERSLLETLNTLPSPARQSALALLAQTITLNRSGHPGEALESARKAATSLDSAGMRAAASVARSEIVYASRWADSYDECEQTWHTLLNSRGPRYPWIQGNARLDYASCLLRLGKAGEARTEIEKAAKDVETARLWPLELRAGQYVAGIDAEIGNYGPVWQTAADGLQRYWTTAASAYRAEAFEFILQRACSGSGLNEASVVFYRAAIRFAHQAGNAEMELSNRSALAELLHKMGDYAGEAQELGNVNRLIDGLGETRDVHTLRWEAALRRVEAMLATKPAADVLPELDRLAANAAGREAIQQIALEQDRGIAFNARGDFARAVDSFKGAIKLNRELAASSNSWVLRIPILESVAPSYRNLTLIQLMQAHDTANALTTWRQFRPNGAGIPSSIDMALLQGTIVVWSDGGRGVQARTVGQNPEDLHRLADVFLALCSSPNSSAGEIRSVGHQLYASLLGPEMRRLSSAVISITADSWLSEIPWGALTDDSGEYLRARRRFVIGYGPSIEKPAGVIAADATALIISAPVAIAPGQPPLPVPPAAEREARQVAARFPRAIVNNSATAGWIAENAPRATIFHFSGHGWANRGNGALILPPGPNREPRFITASDLAKQNWSRCQLAVLSACLSATGEMRGAVNNQSLVQALLGSGARRVIAARWSVDSEATCALMDRFYDELTSGKSVPEALLGAESDVAAVPSWSHPYFWAGFDVFGAV